MGLSTRNYRGSQLYNTDKEEQDSTNRRQTNIFNFSETYEDKPIKDNKEDNNNLQLMNLTNSNCTQSFRELLSDDMTKELEEFRKNAAKPNNNKNNNNNSPRTVK